MKKKLLSLALVGCLAIGASGCSTNYVGYAGMTKELNDLGEYKFDTDMTISLNLADLEQDAGWYPSVSGGQMEDFEIGLSGRVNMKEKYMSLGYDIGKPNEKPMCGGTLYFTEDGIFMNTTSYIEICAWVDNQFQPLTPELYNAYVDKVGLEMIAREEVCLSTNSPFAEKEDGKASTDFMEFTTPESQAIADVIFYFLDTDNLKEVKVKDTFVKKVSGGYELTVTPETLANATKTFVDYVAKNEEKILRDILTEDMIDFVANIPMPIEGQPTVPGGLTTMVDLMMLPQGQEPLVTEIPDVATNITDDMMLSQGTEPQITDIPDYTDDQRYALAVLDIMDAISEVSLATNQYPDEINAVADIFEESKLVSKLIKDTKGYTSTIDMNIVGNTTPLITVKAEMVTKETKVITEKHTGLYLGNLTYNVESVMNENNLPTLLQGYFPKDSESNLLSAYYTLQDGKEVREVLDYFMLNDRTYLPLRAICESLGETVEWDAENAKAYIVRGTEKIDMTSEIRNDRTFIQIRDFEKLGYKVDYKDYGDIRLFTLEK